MISVVIPLYNKEKTIARALLSVLAQTCQDFEVIIINDGSTDGGAAEVERFHDSRIRLIHQANAGVSAARNRGIHESQGDLVAFLDADDEWKPWFLDAVICLREQFPDAQIWATNYEFARADGTRYATRLNGLPPTPWRGIIPDYFALAARSHPPINSSSVAMARAALVRVGGFPEGIRAGEDLITWAKLAVFFPIAYSTQVSSTFWVNSEATSCFTPPSRKPEPEDAVGRQLQALEPALDERRKRSLRRYIARWKRMRANVFSRCGDVSHTLKSAFQAFRLNPREPGVWAFVGLALLHWFRNLPNQRRRITHGPV